MVVCRFLVNCRQRKDSTVVSTQILVDMAIQILLGLMYLHGKNICFKDMAARNAVYVQLSYILCKKRK